MYERRRDQERQREDGTRESAQRQKERGGGVDWIAKLVAQGSQSTSHEENEKRKEMYGEVERKSEKQRTEREAKNRARARERGESRAR